MHTHYAICTAADLQAIPEGLLRGYNAMALDPAVTHPWPPTTKILVAAMPLDTPQASQWKALPFNHLPDALRGGHIGGALLPNFVNLPSVALTNQHTTLDVVDQMVLIDASMQFEIK